MGTKISAAKKLTAAGIPMIIACGLEQDILIKIADNNYTGTYFRITSYNVCYTKLLRG